MPTMERRAFGLTDIRVRAASEDAERLSFAGRAIVYEQLSEDMGGWRERIMPGAATRTLAEAPDVRFLLNHDPNYLLGRTSSGTLRLSEDNGGVAVEADMANVSYARDLAELLERRDITQMSFGFWITADGWDGTTHEVYGIDLDGGDVSVVTYPAFSQTSAELRAAAASRLAPPDEGYPVERARHRLREIELLSRI